MGILDYFKLPEKAKTSLRVYVKDLVSNIEATGQEKSLIEKSINTIHLVGLLNEQTTGIWKYEDESNADEE